MGELKKIQIGTVGESYTHRRNFSRLNQEKVRFKRAYDLLTPYRFMIRFPWFKKRFSSVKLKHMHWEINIGNYDLYHFFDVVSTSKKPWFSSFSTSIPRWGFTEDGVSLLESGSCNKLIALSQCAYNIQSIRLKSSFPLAHDKIMSKTVIIHPPQKKNLSNWDDKKIDLEEPIKFCLVGNHFFRKGGMEILTVFDELKEFNSRISLTIISNIGYGDYASFTTKKDQKRAIDYLDYVQKNNKNITHLKNVPNEKVLEIMKNCHVGLLPTYSDAYGYSLLEFQSFACPVISTDVRALPEINNNKKGWIISVEKNHENEAFFRKPEQRKKLSGDIKNQLKKIILGIIEDPESIRTKGSIALDELYDKNSPVKNSERLLELYQEALQEKN